MVFLDELLNERQAALSRLAAREAKELLACEVAGMRGDHVEETRLIISVAEGAQSDAVHPSDVHRAKILAVISC